MRFLEVLYFWATYFWGAYFWGAYFWHTYVWLLIFGVLIFGCLFYWRIFVTIFLGGHILGYMYFGNYLSIASFEIGVKQKSYKCDNQLITWWTGITRPAGSCNLVTLKTNFAQYKNFVWSSLKDLKPTFNSSRLSLSASGVFSILEKSGMKAWPP